MKRAACSVDGEEICSLWETWLRVSSSLLQYYKDADVLRLFCGNQGIGTVLLRGQANLYFVEGGVKVSLTLYEKGNISYSGYICSASLSIISLTPKSRDPPAFCHKLLALAAGR